MPAKGFLVDDAVPSLEGGAPASFAYADQNGAGTNIVDFSKYTSLSNQPRLEAAAAMADIVREARLAASVTKKVSVIVFIFCCFSFATYFSTGFIVIHPFVGAFVAVASIVFYVMGVMIGRSSHMA